MKKIALFLVASFILFQAPSALATPDYTGELDSAGVAVYGADAVNATSVYYIVGSIISALLSIVGVVFLILILWAGALWMTAGGEEKQVEKAKDMMIRAVIGLVILLASYSISSFVISSLSSATTPAAGTTTL